MTEQGKVVEWNGLTIKARRSSDGKYRVHWMSDWCRCSEAVKAGVIRERFLGPATYGDSELTMPA